MWSDNDIDNAFQRLNPPEPEPTPFPLDAWLRLETELDKAVIERAVRRKLLRFFAAEVIVVALVALAWLLWPASAVAPATKEMVAATAAAGARTTLAAASPTAQANQAKEASSLTPKIASTAVPTTAVSSAAPVASTPSAAASTAATTASTAVVTVTSPGATTEAVATGKHAAAPQLIAAITPDSRPNHSPVTTHTAESRAAATGLIAGVNSSMTAHTRRTIYQAKANAAETARLATASTALNANSFATSKAGSRSTLATGNPYSADLHKAAAFGRRTDGRENRQRGTSHESAVAQVATSAPAAGNDTAGKAATATTETRAASTDFTALAPQPVALAPAELAALPAPLATVAVAEAPAKAEVPAPARQPRIYVGLVAAPDFTTVKFANVESPLPNVGLTLEYRLTNRLRVSTGVLRAKKQYMARRDDYDWGAYHNLVYQHDFQDVDGVCTVLDIPLNLRYDLLVRPQYRLFGSLGLSSFFMQREHYTYDYEENNMYKEWDGGDIVNQNRHFLSILNLSAGYERSLSSHWSLQAEPYFKVPLAGVGVGKVKLTSAGVFLGLKYGF